MLNHNKNDQELLELMQSFLGIFGDVYLLGFVPEEKKRTYLIELEICREVANHLVCGYLNTVDTEEFTQIDLVVAEKLMAQIKKPMVYLTVTNLDEITSLIGFTCKSMTLLGSDSLIYDSLKSFKKHLKVVYSKCV